MRAAELTRSAGAVPRGPAAELEDEQGGPHLQDISRRAGLDLDEVRAAVHRLTSERGLVHEVADTTQPDFGPVYQLSPRT